MICSVITSFFVVQIAADFSARLRELLYRKVQGFSMAEMNRFNTAALITRTTNDVQQVQMLITMGLQMVIKAPITAVWAITKIAGKQWQWSLSVAAAVAFMLASIAIVLLLVTPKFERVNKDFTKANLFTGRITAFLNPVMNMTMNGISLVIYWVGAAVINSAVMQEVWGLFGDMVVFMSYGMQIISSFMMLAVMFMIAPRSIVSARRINEVLEVEEMIKDGEGVGETSETGTVEFRDVSFRYPDSEEDVLSHISFKAEKGQTVAFIGSTGCGKSTVVNLVSRFYDTSKGSVMVDGHCVREYKKSELAGKIGYVSQKALLFSGDIQSNVNFGDNGADEAMVEKAVEISQSTDFIEAVKGGIRRHVAQNGNRGKESTGSCLKTARLIRRLHTAS